MMYQLYLPTPLYILPMATLAIIMDTLPMVAPTMEDICPSLMEPTGSSVLLQLLEYLELPMPLPMDMYHSTIIKL